ncbi:hypothetical protein Tco_0220130 [Tanacetum coccineum]
MIEHIWPYFIGTKMVCHSYFTPNETQGWVPEFTDEYESEDDNSMDEEDVIKVGQVMRFKMEGVIANLEELIGTQRGKEGYR